MLLPTFALLYEVDHRIGTLWPIFSLLVTSNSYVSLGFELEKKASIFLVFFASENTSYCSFTNDGTVFLINKDTSAKFTSRKSVGYHVFGSVKALNTECWTQCYSCYTTCLFGKFHARLNIGKEVSQSVTVFRDCQRRMNREERER